MDVSQKSGSKRGAVLFVVRGEKFALEPRHVNTDRALCFARATLQAEVKGLVDIVIAESRCAQLSRHGLS